MSLDHFVELAKQESPEPEDFVWGAKAIGEVVGLTGQKGLRRVYYLLENGLLPAKQVGQSYVGSRSRLRAHLLGERDAKAA